MKENVLNEKAADYLTELVTSKGEHNAHVLKMKRQQAFWSMPIQREPVGVFHYQGS